MRFKKQKPLLSILVGAGLYYLFDSLREHLLDNVDDIKGRVRDRYDTASERVSRAGDALRGREDSQILGKGGALVIGVGIGVGIGLLIAPASGEQTRANINDKVSEFSDKVRENCEEVAELYRDSRRVIDDRSTDATQAWTPATTPYNREKLVDCRSRQLFRFISNLLLSALHTSGQEGKPFGLLQRPSSSTTRARLR